MHALLAALFLATAPAASPEPAPASPPAPRWTLWTQPVGTVVSGLVGGPVYIPVGATVPLTETTGLAMELTFVYGSMRAAEDTSDALATGRFWRVLAAAGPVFSLRGEALSGPFLQPKVLAIASGEPDYAFNETRHLGGRSLELQLGLDVGWQFTTGGWYFAPVLGVSAGRCFNCAVDSDSAWEPSHVLEPRRYGYSARRDARTVLGLNLNLLRAGTSF